MCSPSTVGNIGLGAQVVGGAGQTYSAYKKSAGAKRGYEYQAQVASNNALLAEWQAQDAMLRGVAAKNAVQLKGAQVMGTQRAVFASRNIAMDEGSALNVLADTAYMVDRDANTVEDNARKEAWALRNQATGYRANAAFLSERAADESPLMEAGGTALTAAGRVASAWYDSKNRSGSTSRMPTEGDDAYNFWGLRG